MSHPAEYLFTLLQSIDVNSSDDLIQFAKENQKFQMYIQENLLKEHINRLRLKDGKQPKDDLEIGADDALPFRIGIILDYLIKLDEKEADAYCKKMQTVVENIFQLLNTSPQNKKEGIVLWGEEHGFVTSVETAFQVAESFGFQFPEDDVDLLAVRETLSDKNILQKLMPFVPQKPEMKVIVDLSAAKPEEVFFNLSELRYNKQPLKAGFPRVNRQALLQYLIEQVQSDPLIPLNKTLHALENLQGISSSKNPSQDRALIYDAYHSKITGLTAAASLNDEQKIQLFQFFNELELELATPQPKKGAEKNARGKLEALAEDYSAADMKLKVGDKIIELGAKIAKEREDRKNYEKFRVKFEAIKTVGSEEKLPKIIAYIKELTNNNIALMNPPLEQYKNGISAFLSNDQNLLKALLASDSGLSALEHKAIALNYMRHVGFPALQKMVFAEPEMYILLLNHSAMGVQELEKIYVGLSTDQIKQLNEKLHEAIERKDVNAILALKGFKTDINFEKNGKSIAKLLEIGSANPVAWNEFVKKSGLSDILSGSIMENCIKNQKRLTEAAVLIAPICSPHASSAFPAKKGNRLQMLKATVNPTHQEETAFVNFIKASGITAKGKEYQLTPKELADLQRLNSQISKLLYPDGLPNEQKLNDLEIKSRQLDEKIKQLSADIQKIEADLKSHGVDPSKSFELSQTDAELMQQKDKLAKELKSTQDILKPIEAEYNKYKKINKEYSEFMMDVRGASNSSLLNGNIKQFGRMLQQNPALYALMMNNLELVESVNNKFQLYQKEMNIGLDEAYFKKSEELKAKKREELEVFRKEKGDTEGDFEKRKAEKFIGSSDARPRTTTYNEIKGASSIQELSAAITKLGSEKVDAKEITNAILYDLQDKISAYQKDPKSVALTEIFIKYVELAKRGKVPEDNLKQALDKTLQNISRSKRNGILSAVDVADKTLAESMAPSTGRALANTAQKRVVKARKWVSETKGPFHYIREKFNSSLKSATPEISQPTLQAKQAPTDPDRLTMDRNLIAGTPQTLKMLFEPYKDPLDASAKKTVENVITQHLNTLMTHIISRYPAEHDFHKQATKQIAEINGQFNKYKNDKITFKEFIEINDGLIKSAQSSQSLSAHKPITILSTMQNDKVKKAAQLQLLMPQQRAVRDCLQTLQTALDEINKGRCPDFCQADVPLPIAEKAVVALINKLTDLQTQDKIDSAKVKALPFDVGAGRVLKQANPLAELSKNLPALEVSTKSKINPGSRHS